MTVERFERNLEVTRLSAASAHSQGMPQQRYNRPYPGRCRECRRDRQCFSVRKVQGGSYNRAARHGSGMLCVECILAMLPYAVRRPAGYSGDGRWDRRNLLFWAQDLYVPCTKAEALSAAQT